jgi:hypothetical protein
MELIRHVFIVHYFGEFCVVDDEFDPCKFKSQEFSSLKEAVKFAQGNCDYSGASSIEEANIYRTKYGIEKEIIKHWECTQTEYYETR